MAADQALELALSSVLLLPGGKELRSECYNALEDIFLSCYMLAIEEVEEEEEDCIALTTAQILQREDGNQLILFLHGLQGQTPSEESISELLARYGDGPSRVPIDLKEATPSGEAQMEEKKMGLSGFLQLVTDTASVEVNPQLISNITGHWSLLVSMYLIRSEGFGLDYMLLDLICTWRGYQKWAPPHLGAWPRTRH